MDRRALRDRPFTDEHADSQARLMRSPRTLSQHLAWFLEGWRAEMPEAVHAAGVWFGRPSPVDASSGEPIEEIPAELVGGSVLGAPKLHEAFRAFIENSPRQTDEDDAGEFYVRPMRAALRNLAGRSADGDAPFMARFLVAVALVDGDWASVCDRWAIRREVAKIWTEAALQRLYACYRADPAPRAVRTDA